MRRFYLDRGEDVTGVSGTGRVAEGVLFSNGYVGVTWLSAHTSVVFYPQGLASIEAIHLHHGATKLVWIDEESEGERA